MQIYPNFIDALNKKALTLYRLQQYDKALEKLDEAISMDTNNSHAYNLKGLALMNCNRYSEALSAFDKSIEIDSKYLAPLKNKGIVSMKNQKYNEAIDIFTNALQIDPIDQFAMDAKSTAMHLLNLYSRLYVIDEASEMKSGPDGLSEYCGTHGKKGAHSSHNN